MNTASTLEKCPQHHSRCHGALGLAGTGPTAERAAIQVTPLRQSGLIPHVSPNMHAMPGFGSTPAADPLEKKRREVYVGNLTMGQVRAAEKEEGNEGLQG